MEGPDRPLFPEGVPMGLGMAMLQYPGAMEKYGALEEEAQRQLIEDAKGIPSKEEMQALCGAFRHRRRITPRPRHPSGCCNPRTHPPVPLQRPFLFFQGKRGAVCSPVEGIADSPHTGWNPYDVSAGRTHRSAPTMISQHST